MIEGTDITTGAAGLLELAAILLGAAAVAGAVWCAVWWWQS